MKTFSDCQCSFYEIHENSIFKNEKSFLSSLFIQERKKKKSLCSFPLALGTALPSAGR